MKRRLHIQDFMTKAIADALRKKGRESDAEIFDNIDATTWRTGYTSGDTLGSSGNPCKAYNGNITLYNMTFKRPIVYPNGVKTSFGPSVLHTIALIPKELRPPYLGDLTVSENNAAIPAERLGLDLSKCGCYYYSISNSDAKFVVVVGSNESPTTHSDVVKYLPFDMFPGNWSGGIKSVSDMGYSGRGSSSISDNRMVPVELIVYKGTSPAEEPKSINPNLPNWKLNDFTPSVPDGYYYIPPTNITVDWNKLAGKYTKKVHINQIFIDLVADAFESAGKTEYANKVRSINPKTFLAWSAANNGSAGTVTLKGSRDTTAKVYFDSVTINNYQGKNITKISELGYVYAASAGISWQKLADTKTLQSSSSDALMSENTYGYFGKHVPSGFVANEENIDAFLPFSVIGSRGVYRNAPITSPYQVDISPQPLQGVWCGSNAYTLYIYPDR